MPLHIFKLLNWTVEEFFYPVSLLGFRDSRPEHIRLIVTNGNYACCQDYFCDKCALMFTKVLHQQNHGVGSGVGSPEKQLWNYILPAFLVLNM